MKQMKQLIKPLTFERYYAIIIIERKKRMNSFQGNNGTIFEFNNDYSGRIIVYRTNGEGVVEMDGRDFF